MAILQEYHRPATLDEALRLLAQTDRTLRPLAGGSRLVGELELHSRPDVDGVVDLRAVGLDKLTVETTHLQIGATVTLTALVDHPVAGTLADGLLRRAAGGEGPLNLRNVATVGGIVACAAADSELYAALLALDARVTHWHAGREQITPLAALPAAPGLIIALTLPRPAAAQRGGHARVARTLSDRPIVAALAVVEGAHVRVALCGVAARPILQGAPLEPPDDFKGSAAYRRALVEVVTARALAAAQGT
jgi:CO/xanthine dehydrogenase FAD-binding subunit